MADNTKTHDFLALMQKLGGHDLDMTFWGNTFKSL